MPIDVYNIRARSNPNRWEVNQASKPSSDPDQWYYDLIEQYKGTDFYDTLKSNPYLVGNNAAFSPNLFQSIGEGLFGDTSARDRYYGDLRSRANEFLTQKIDEMRQQDYNSASSQVNQMRAAGLNPDLQDVQPGSAAENDQPIGNGPQMSDESSVQQALSGFASLTMSAYSFASGFAKDMFSFQQMKNAIDNQDIEIYDKVRSSVRDFIRDSAIRPHFDANTGNWTIDRQDDGVVEAFADTAFRSKRARKLFTDEYFRAYSSARNELARITDVNDAEGAVKALNFAIADNQAYGYYYNNSPSSAVQQPIVLVAKELQSLRKDLLQIQTQYSFDKAAYDDDVVTRLDAGSAASAINEGNKASSANYENAQIKAKIDSVVNKNLENIISKLESMSNRPGLPGVLAQGMLLYYSAFGLQLPSLPSVSIGGTTNVTSVRTNP